MIGWLVETLLTVTFLMLLVMVLRGPVTRLFGAGWAYALWAVPAIRVALPPLPQLTPDIALPVAAFFPVAAGSAAPLPADAGPGQWVPLMLAIWAGGAVIFMTIQWLAYRDFVHRLGLTARPARPPSYGGIMTFVSQAAEGPLALGLIERRIVLPCDFLFRYSVAERRLALEHELTHHRRGDIWWNMAATTLLALNWFNPIAWAAFRAFRADQELSCDAVVAARATAEERCDYARAMVKSASRPGLIGACALNSSGALKLRLRMMRCHRVSGARRAGGIAAFALFATLGFAVGRPDYVPAAATVVPPAADALVAREPAPAPAPAPAFAAAPAAAPRIARLPHRAAAHPARRAKPLHAPSRAAPQLASLVAPAALPMTPVRVSEIAPPAPAPALALSVEPLPVVALTPPHHRIVRIERRHVVRLDSEPIVDRLFFRTAHPVPANEIEEEIAHLAEEIEGLGGAMSLDALGTIMEAKTVVRGLQTRAPDMWNDDEAVGECLK